MVDLLLIFPYFNNDYSIFKFPPLGLGYIASYVREQGYSVELLDCTFTSKREALFRAKSLKPEVVGIYSMLTMKKSSIRFARELRDHCELLVAGGPLPTVYPETFLTDFDLVVIGEGEETMLEIMNAFDSSRSLSKIQGIAYKRMNCIHKSEVNSQLHHTIVQTEPRKPVSDLDKIPFPARDLFDHEGYKHFFRQNHGYTITSIITSRGCPFYCDFCSQPVFGHTYRGRSAKNIVDELEEIHRYGYERIWFADDIFPMGRRHIQEVCAEIMERGLDIGWECLCRVDLMNREVARFMKKAGCIRVFFGIESGSNEVLKLMNKGIDVEQAKRAVKAAVYEGVNVGAFFILGYPGETDETMLKTINFSTSLPLDYLSFTVPYPIPGTGLYERMKDRIISEEWEKSRLSIVDQQLIYRSDFSPTKLKFGIIKAGIQHRLKKYLGRNSLFPMKIFETVTDRIFRMLK